MKLPVSVIFLALAPIAGASAGVDAPALITLHEHAVVTAAHIRLADVADVQAVDPARRESLQAAKIAPAPGIGTHRTLTRKDVERSLARTAEHGFVIEGAPVTTIERPAADYEGAAFVDVARRFLLARLSEEHPDLARLEVTPVGDLPAVRGPAGESRLTARSVRGDMLAKRVSVWVDLEINGALYRRVPVWLAVNAYRPVWVSQRAYRGKEPFMTSDFAVEERDVAALRGAPLALDASLAGLRARRSMSAGGIVQAADVEAQPPVIAHEEIDVRLLAGPIAIDTRAIAEEEGARGAYIRVRNPASALTYTARVVDRGKALVADR